MRNSIPRGVRKHSQDRQSRSSFTPVTPVVYNPRPLPHPFLFSSIIPQPTNFHHKLQLTRTNCFEPRTSIQSRKNRSQSTIMSGIINKVKDALTGDKHTSEAHAANQGSSGRYTHPCYHPAQQLKPTAYDSTATGTGHHHGTHHSGTTTGSGLTGSGTHATSGTTGTGLTGSHHQTTAGPHSDIGNKIDPRVDSDMDGSRNMGANKMGTSTTGAGYGSSTTGSGVTGSGMTGTHHPTTAGPHGNLGNKMVRSSSRIKDILRPHSHFSGPPC